MGTPAPPLEELDANQVQVGTPNGPGIWIGPALTPLPESTDADFADPWRILGYLSDDGPTVGQSTDSEDLTPWQSVAPIRTVITGRSLTLQFVLWQLNSLTLSVYFDTDEPEPSQDGSLDMDIRTDQAGHVHAAAIDARDGNRVLRVGFLRATLSDAGDMPISRGAVIPLDCTLSALETSGRLGRIMQGPSNPAQPFSISRNGTNGPSTVEGAVRRGTGRRSQSGLVVGETAPPAEGT